MRRNVLLAVWCAAFAAVSCGGRHESSPSKSCQYGGVTHPDGANFPSTDGCNDCTCDAGTVACSSKDCAPSCADLASQHQAATEAMKVCDPTSPNSCTKLVTQGLPCSCPTFANPERSQALEEAAGLAQQYEANGCNRPVLCGACQSPLRAHCSSDGRCDDDFDEASCKVGGVVYPSGTGDIQDPFSCNRCSCSAGQLACTEIGCPKPCPAGKAPGTSCAECGPTDACLVVEHACMPVCTDTCEGGASCIDGLCRNVCG